MDHTLAYARQLDRQDELAPFRDHFAIDDAAPIYLDGNSLGRPPAASILRVDEVLRQEWQERLIGGWAAGWYDAPARVGDKIGRVIGAAPGQVLVSDSTSVNLFKLTVAALRARPERERIVSDVLNFPSDLYILEGCIELLGARHQLISAPASDGISVDLEALTAAIDERVALVLLSHVAFKSGFLHDMEALTRRAHEVGALVLWDLSHSVGVVPMAVDRWDVDLAVGCTYKYLNGGPGAPAFLYVRHSLQEHLRSPIQGWFGQREAFGFDLEYSPAAGATRFLVGTPPVLSLAAIEPAIDLVIEAGIERIRGKSVALTRYCIELIDRVLAPLGCTLGSPRDAARRGSHVSVRHQDAYRVMRTLIDQRAVLPDFREPDNIRLGLAPLYTSYEEVWTAIERIRQVLAGGQYLRLSKRRETVT